MWGGGALRYPFGGCDTLLGRSWRRRAIVGFGTVGGVTATSIPTPAIRPLRALGWLLLWGLGGDLLLLLVGEVGLGQLHLAHFHLLIGKRLLVGAERHLLLRGLGLGA